MNGNLQDVNWMFLLPVARAHYLRCMCVCVRVCALVCTIACVFVFVSCLAHPVSIQVQ